MSRSLVILILTLTPLTGVTQEVRRDEISDEIWKALASKHDADGDGRIDLSEYPRGEERFRALDRLDDQVNRDYAAWPDRLYLVGRDGRIVYAGGRGPRGFQPDELEQAILQELGKP
jgi:hypothetical protein